MAQQIALLAIQLGIIIFSAKLMGALATKFKIPSVMGELLAGIIIGPYCLGSIALPCHGFEGGLFPLVQTVIGIPIDGKLYAIASLGSIVLLFLSGLETDVRTFFKYSIAGSFVGLGGIIFSFLCGVSVGIVVLGWDFMDPRCLFLGILCTATSVGISARILSEHRAMDSPEGVTIMAAAVIDDVLGIVCLAIVIGIANVELNGGSMAWGNIAWITVRSFGIWLGVTAIGLIFARRIAGFLKLFKSPRVFAVLSFGFALILAGLFEEAGLAMIIGAFVMGLSLSKTDIAFTVRAALAPVYNFLVPVFFVVMGMLVDVRVLKDPKVLTVGLIFALMAIIGKVVGCFVPAFLMNFNSVGALRIGVGMVPRCEVVLIIAGIAATTMMKNPALKAPKMESNGQTQLVAAEEIPEQVPIFDSRLFGIAIIMPLVTALLAPPLLNMALTIKKRGTRHEVPDKDSTLTTFDFGTEAVIPTVLNEFMTLMSEDGFMYSSFSKGMRVIQFRRDKTSITLEINGSAFNFSSSPDDIQLIKTGIYESIVEIHRTLSELKQLAQPTSYKNDLILANQTTPQQQTKHKKKVFMLDKFIVPEQILINIEAPDKQDAIKQLVTVIKARHPEIDAEKCIKDILDRENIVSTYQDNGIAMPHTRTDGTPSFFSAIGISEKGILYDANENLLANIIIVSLCPKDEPGPYLQYIAQVSQVLLDDTKRAAIIQAKTPQEAAGRFA